MTKRGQGLPLNVIVISIIVVVALVVIIAFFLGAFGQLGGRAGTTTGTALEGTELGLAVGSCKNLCNQARALPTNILRDASPYCKKQFSVDINSDGASESQTCRDLGVPCDDDKGKSVCPT